MLPFSEQSMTGKSTDADGPCFSLSSYMGLFRRLINDVLTACAPENVLLRTLRQPQHKYPLPSEKP